MSARQEKTVFAVIIALAIATAATISAFSDNKQATRPVKDQQQTQEKKVAELESQFPVADYTEPEPSDPKQIQRRREKGAKYDKPEVMVDAYSELVVGSPHWADGIPAFPIKQSAAIVIGNVTGAQARMSNNKKGVYSEFTFQVEEVLKNDDGKSLTSNSSVTLDREGGRVRLPSGMVGIYYISGQGSPRIGRRYVLFLSGKKSPDFTVVTGYELREGKVLPLDYPGSGHPFTKYDGADEQSFLAELRAAIADSHESK